MVLEHQSTDPVPKNLAKLTRLRHLLLSGNRFTGTIPEVNGLTGILITDLSRNFFSGSLPLKRWRIEVTVELDVSNNYLELKLPEELQSL